MTDKIVKFNTKKGVKAFIVKHPKKQKAEKDAYGKKIGELKAEEHFKNTKKGWLKSIRDHLGKWIDNIDPLDLFAVIALTIVIKKIVDASEELLSGISVMGNVTRAKIVPPGQLRPPWQPRIPPIPRRPTTLPDGGERLSGPYGWAWREFMPPELNQMLTGLVEGAPEYELFEWAICFVIAYIIIKQGGQLMGLLGEGVKGITAMTKWFILG